jgi:hypothetical protein
MALLTLNDLKYNMQQYFAFSREEMQGIIIAIIGMSIIIGFNDGAPSFELFNWTRNLISVILIVALAYLAQESAKRIVGLWWGYRVEYKVFYPGLILGFMITVMTLGKYWWLWILIPSGIMLHTIEGQRLGYFRHFLRYWDVGVVALMGPLANIVLALIFKSLYLLMPGNILLDLAVKINIMLAIGTLLPIPPVAGHNILYASRWMYFVTLGIAITLAVLFVIPGLSLYFMLSGVFLGVVVGLLLFALVIKAKVL